MQWSMANLPWGWNERMKGSGKDAEDAFDTLGVGRFAKDIAVMAVPMALVAGLFGLWMNSRIADFKEAITEAVTAHAQAERDIHEHMVNRAEFDAYKQLMEERHIQERKDNDQQMVQIRRNTALLERIATKVGVSRGFTD